VTALIPLDSVARGVCGEKLSKQTNAAPLDPARPLLALTKVLRLLGQEASKQLAEGSIEDFWRWAVANWHVAHIPRVPGVIVETPDGASI
jgi:glutamyl-Q tRNA(Asp) synthetase